MEDIPIFFDLQRALMNDPDFADEIQKTLVKLLTATSNSDIAQQTKLFTALLKKCDFNPSLFLPYFFPNFSDGEPMTLWKYPHSFSMMALIPNGSLTVCASRQVGKCLHGDTEVTVKFTQESQEPVSLSLEDMFRLAETD